MATTAVLHPDPQKFPAGTTVKAYKRSNWANQTVAPSGTPEGSQDASATVATDGSVSFTGLTDETAYVLYAATPDRYAFFSTRTASDDAQTVTVSNSPAVTIAAGSAAIGKVGHDTTGGGVGRKTSTTVGTPVALAASTPAKWVRVTALLTNDKAVAVGYGASVLATLGSEKGDMLLAGDFREYAITNLTDIQIDVLTSGHGVSFTYGT